MRSLLRYGGLLLGSLLAAVILLSNRLGLSDQARWGSSRRLLFSLGLALAAGSLVTIIYHARWFPPAVRARLQAAGAVVGRWGGRAAASPRGGLLFGGLVLGLTGLFSVWYGSAGLWPAFPPLDNLYIQQADAFLHGQIALLDQPSPGLMALDDPYDYQARKGITYVWDASYYQGKYYLYWGPVPALGFAGYQLLTGSRPPGPLGVILAVIGLSGVCFYLLWQIRRRVFPQAPPFSMGVFLLALVLNAPVLFVLGRGQVYETSIISGQLFIYLGLAAWFHYRQVNRPGWLAVTGLFWALAAITRYNLVVSIVIFLGFALPGLWRQAGSRRQSDSRRQALGRLAVLLIPLGVGAVGLGIFNALRFGSPFETGLQYQLTAPVGRASLFSPAFIGSNLYLYLWYPYMKVGVFPVIRSIAVIPEHIPTWAAFHSIKQGDAAIFSLRAVPLLWSLLPLGAWLAGRRWLTGKRLAPNDAPVGQPGLTGWPELAWMIGLSGLAQFVFLLFYYFTAGRFMVDFYPAWLLSLVFAVWAVDRQLVGRRWLRVGLWLAVIFLVGWTAGLGFFAGFDNPPQVFHTYNPGLEAAIAAGWNRLYSDPGIVGLVLRLTLARIL